jgi:hypothetical protein
MQGRTQKRDASMLHRPRFAVAMSPLLLLSLSSLAAPTHGGFVANRPLPVGGSPYFTAAADINHDGIPDLLVADGTTTTRDSSGASTQTAQGIAVLLGKGDGTFGAPAHFPTTHSASFICVADVNGDGHPDALTADFDHTLFSPGGAIEVLLGNGDGTFKAPVSYTVPNAYVEWVFAADVNGDGRVDLIAATTPIASSSPQGMAVFLNNGSGGFQIGQQISAGSPFAVGDLNKDGKLDLVVVNVIFSATSSPSYSLAIYAGAGNGTFAQTGPIYDVGSGDSVASAALADFNGDGSQDIALTVGNNAVVIMLGDGAGRFTAAATTVPVDQRPSVVLAGDFNHDGHQDIAVLSSVYSVVDVLFGRGDGTFNFRAIYGTDGGGSIAFGALTSADLNRDGYTDLISTDDSGFVSPLLGKPGGTFGAATEYALGSFRNADTLHADFNGDGIPDLAVLNVGGGCPLCFASVSVLQGKGNGQFKPLGVRYKTGTLGAAFAAGDLNGDGKMDILVEGDYARDGYAPFGLLLGNGDGTFQAARTLTNVCPDGGAELRLVDINHDGKLDAASSCGIALGNGNGTFQNPIAFPGSFVQFEFADFNKDGQLDLAIVGPGTPAPLTIFKGNGDGSFTTAGSFSTSVPYGYGYSNFLAVGRFTSNGNVGAVIGAREADTFTQGAYTGAFTIFPGNGNGTLGAGTTYNLPQFLQSLTVADFNGDGLDDLAVVNEDSSDRQVYGHYAQLSLYTSKGDGTLLAPIQFGSGDMWKLTAADFNRDGAVDLAGNVDGLGEGILMNSNGTSVVLATSAATVKAGQAVTFTATVTASFRFSGALNGNVSFYRDNVLLGTIALSGGVAHWTTSTLTAGTHQITAVYLGNASYNAHGSNAIVELVQP